MVDAILESTLNGRAQQAMAQRDHLDSQTLTLVRHRCRGYQPNHRGLMRFGGEGLSRDVA
jgi:hypothetical protein